MESNQELGGQEVEKMLRLLVRLEPATEDDAQTIIELRKQIWATTYRGFYPDSMIDEFDYRPYGGRGGHRG